jgi:glucose/arabinose dehydrogenase
MRTTSILLATSTLILAAASCGDDDDADSRGAGGTGGEGGAGQAGAMATGGTTATGGGTDGVAGSGGEPGGEAGAGGAPSALMSVGLETVATGLNSPVVLREAPDETGRLFVIDRVGTIRIVTAEGELLDDPFLDISDDMVELMDDFDERGLLGFDFHPEYADNGRFFVYYSAPPRAEAPDGYDHTARISEFQVSEGDANLADPTTETIVLEVDEPQFNHDGGQILFGPDDYLYIALGDGGNADDVGLGHVEDWYDVNEGGNGQDIEENLLGSILRIDVDGGEPYAIPPDNPFADSPMPEIWAYGFRNPFRMAFDSGGDEQLFVGDVGQNRWEEVSIVEAGQNYGWNVREGTHCFSTESPGEDLDDCADTGSMDEPLVDPILEYANGNQSGGIGLSVIGGHVYRGEELPELEGRYVFGDWSTSFETGDGTLFVASGAGTDWTMEELAVDGRAGGRLGEFVLSFGEDAAGELYLLTNEEPGPTGTTGKVYRIIAP